MITIINKPDDAVEAFVSLLSDELRLDRSVLLLVPGGSASDIAFAALDILSKSNTSTTRLTVTLTDERFGSVGHSDSNWPKYLPLINQLPNSQFIPVLRDVDIAQTTTLWDQELHGALEMADTVIALFGIGTDGHIAGIKPGSSACDSLDMLACSYTASDFERVTITPAFFQTINTSVIYAEGTNKRTTVENLNSTIAPSTMPAQFVKASKSVLVYYMVK